jgi:hypothetical protein
VERIGPQHQAGSDSLLTSLTFLKLADKFFAGVGGAQVRGTGEGGVWAARGSCCELLGAAGAPLPGRCRVGQAHATRSCRGSCQQLAPLPLQKHMGVLYGLGVDGNNDFKQPE